MSRWVPGAPKNMSGGGLGGFREVWKGPRGVSGRVLGVSGGAWRLGWAPGGTQVRFLLILGCLWDVFLWAFGRIFLIFSMLFCKWLKKSVFLWFFKVLGFKIWGIPVGKCWFSIVKTMVFVKNMIFWNLTLRVAPGPFQDRFWEGFGVPVALVLGVLKHIDSEVDFLWILDAFGRV